LTKTIPTLRVVHGLICDDVRSELFHKETLVGVYQTGIAVRSLPWTSNICLWMAVIWNGEGDVDLEVRVLDPKNRQVAEALGKARAIQQGKETSLTFRGLSVRIETEGPYLVQWRAVGGIWETVKTFSVALVRT
jgi:hypothetical protein